MLLSKIFFLFLKKFYVIFKETWQQNNVVISFNCNIYSTKLTIITK